jgi:aquaporin Z
MRKFAAEVVGTFGLVFAGTGAIVVNDVTGGTVSHVGVALTFGLIVLAMIYAVGDVSGAHLNPAVTLGFFTARRFPGRSVLPYIASQCAGAFLASLCLRLLFPGHATLGATFPRGDALQSFVLEVLLTALLMFVILCVSTGSKEKGITAGIAVGSVIGLEALFAGPISGASMNPVRSLAPAVVSLRFESLWVYLAAPTLGACVGVLAWRCVHERGLSPPGGPGPEVTKGDFMNVQKFNQLLASNPSAALSIMLPNGEFVPDHFHITEVGRAHKQFIDCGGTRRETLTALLQVWVANDADHRLDSTKLSQIMKVGAGFLKDDMPLVVEYGSETVANYPLGDVEVTPKGLLLVLGNKPTACLAMEKCGVEGCC